MNKIFHETNSSVNTSLEPLNEIAFEKSRELKHVEKLIDRLKQIKDPDKWDESSIKTEIEKILAGFFGFKAVSIYVVYDFGKDGKIILKTPNFPYPTAPNAAALMMHAVSKKDIKQNIGVGEILGSKKKKKLKKFTNSTTKRLKSKDEDELYYTTKMKPYSMIFADPKSRLIPANKKDEFFTITKKGYKVNTDVYPIEPTILINYSLIQKFSSKTILATLLHEIGHLFNNMQHQSDMIQTRLDEINADKFATAYGYGDHNADLFISEMKRRSEMDQRVYDQLSDPSGVESAMIKLQHPDLDLDFTDPKIRTAYFRDQLYQTDYNERDPHPIFARLIYQMDQIREDLKHEKNPKIQNRLIHNLKRIRDAFEAFKSDPNNKISTQTIQAEIVSCNKLLGQYAKLLNPTQHNKSLKKYQV